MTYGRNGLILPFLASLYAALEPCAYVLMRVTTGLAIAPIGYAKLFRGGLPAVISEFHKLGLEPATTLAHFIGGLEFFGGIAIAIGLLTRPVALMFFIEMLVIGVMVMLPRGTGYQLTLVWVGVFALIAMRGAGGLSVDRLLRREF